MQAVSSIVLLSSEEVLCVKYSSNAGANQITTLLHFFKKKKSFTVLNMKAWTGLAF